MGRYIGWFEDRASVADNFRVELPSTVDIIVAGYDDPHDYGYYGEAKVYFYDTAAKQFYMVAASHCSCYGLEDQWEPEQVTIKDMIADLGNECGGWPALATALREELRARFGMA